MNPRAGAPECTPQMPPPARSATTLRQTAPEATRGTSARPRAEAKSPISPKWAAAGRLRQGGGAFIRTTRLPHFAALTRIDPPLLARNDPLSPVTPGGPRRDSDGAQAGSCEPRCSPRRRELRGGLGCQCGSSDSTADREDAPALPSAAEPITRGRKVAAEDDGRTPCPDDFNKPLPLRGV